MRRSARALQIKGGVSAYALIPYPGTPVKFCPKQASTSEHGTQYVGTGHSALVEKHPYWLDHVEHRQQQNQDRTTGVQHERAPVVAVRIRTPKHPQSLPDGSMDPSLSQPAQLDICHLAAYTHSMMGIYQPRWCLSGICITCRGLKRCLEASTSALQQSVRQKSTDVGSSFTSMLSARPCRHPRW